LWRGLPPLMNRKVLIRFVGVGVFRGFRVVWRFVGKGRDLVEAVPGEIRMGWRGV